MTTVQLMPILADGSVNGYDEDLSSGVSEMLRHTVRLYSDIGFEPPWIGYLAIAERLPVGICSFKSPPANGRVEIAYLTFPGFENRGVASDMASQLVAMADEGSVACIAAQTLLERSASHRVLEKLGFQAMEVVDHADDGAVLEWHWKGRERRRGGE